MGEAKGLQSFKLPENPTYGFVGIGVMGYGMAMNLRAKIPESTRFVLCEINEARRDQFLKTCSGSVEVAASPAEVAEKAVGEHQKKEIQNLSRRVNICTEERKTAGGFERSLSLEKGKWNANSPCVFRTS